MFLKILLSLLLAAGVYSFLWFRRNFSYWSHYKVVPSVPGRIFSGNFGDFIALKTHLGLHMKTIYDDPRFAQEAAVGIYGLYKPALLIREPDLLKSILIRDFDCFSNRFAQPDVRDDRLASLMIFFAHNSYWKEMRSNLTPFFSSGKLKQMFSLIQEVGQNLEDHLRRRGEHFVAEIKQLCLLYTIDVSATTIFGFQTNSLVNPEEPIHKEARRLVDFSWFRALNYMFVFFMPNLCSPLGIRSFNKETEVFLKTIITQIMAERETTGVRRNDLIDILLKLKQEAIANGQDLTTCMEGLYAQAAIFWIGGFETSSSVISHALMELAHQPELLQRLRAEILQALTEGSGHLTYESLNKLKYLDMVISETMRLYPLFAFLERKYAKPPGRTNDYTLRPYYDFTLPEGMPMYISVYGLHYDENYWPNPKKFDPERFSAENRAHINPMVYLPFGEGPRNCIGARLGLLQVKLALVHFLKNHYVQLCPQTQINPEFDPKAVILQIKGGIYLEVVRDDMCVRVETKE